MLLLVKPDVVHPQSLLCKPRFNQAQWTLLVQAEDLLRQWVGSLKQSPILREVLLLLNRGQVRLKPRHQRVNAWARDIEQFQKGRKPSSTATSKAVPHSCGRVEAEGGLALTCLLAVDWAKPDPVVPCAFL